MLNLSPQSVSDQVRAIGPKALDKVDLPAGQTMFRRWLLGLLIFTLIMMFMPWVQNFRAKGLVTSLAAGDRPQSVHATLPGRIEAWYVLEGDTVRRGDTIARMSEIKSEYFDPQLVERTGRARDAKENSAENYLLKADALGRQITALRQEKELKLEQAKNKLAQSRLYVNTLRADLAQQETQVDIADFQLRRIDTLFNQGLKSLTDRESRVLKAQEARAKLVATQNKLDQAVTDVEQAQLQLVSVGPEYDNKIAKAQSDRQSAITAYYAAEGDVAKLESDVANYSIRRDNNIIVAPQNGIIGTILTPGLGETVKEGESILTILPQGFRPAVEMFVDPFNLSLIQKGQNVRFLFDGWPAVFFSGWPGLSYGTFVGDIVAIDNIIDSKGNYRVLVAPSVDGRDWPDVLRPGSGAEGVVLLNTVPVWYELWRQLNAFPPDYYDNSGTYVEDEKEGVKKKAPAKAAVK